MVRKFVFFLGPEYLTFLQLPSRTLRNSLPGCPLSASVVNQTAPPLKERASLVFFSLMGRVERFPCLIVNRSQDGFGLVVGSGLRQGQFVDLILDEEPSKPVRTAWHG